MTVRLSSGPRAIVATLKTALAPRILSLAAPVLAGLMLASDQAMAEIRDLGPGDDLQAAARAAAPGDVLRLAPGDYRSVRIGGARPGAEVRIVGPEDGPPARFWSLTVRNSENLTLENLAVWPEPGSNQRRGPLVQTTGKTRRITFRNLDIRAAEDAGDYMAWSKEDWNDNRWGGVYLRGVEDAIEDSTLTGTRFAIASTGPRDRVIDNTVLGFSGDAMRGLGDGSIYRGNRVQDCVKIDGNHDDAFQSWSRGPDGKPGRGAVDGLVIEANTILEWTGPEDHPLRCQLQGIGLFDGMFDNIVIRNNVISVSAYHGITVGGGKGVTVVNNTVLSAGKPRRDRPWISVWKHRNGTPPSDVHVANNIAPDVRIIKTARGVVQSANLIAPYPGMVLKAPYAGDFSPLPDGAAVGTADPRFAPETDMTGARRPADGAPDIGAVELR